MTQDIFRNPIVKAAFGLLQVVVVSLTTYILVEVSALGKSVAALEIDCLHSRDGLEIWREIGDLKEQIAGIPKDNPPQWFVDQVSDLKEAIRRIDERIDKLASGKK